MKIVWTARERPVVHGEALARPVDAVAELAHLAEDPAAGLLLPLPDPLDERLAAEVVPGQALLGELALDDVLGGDAGVVHAGQPERLVPCIRARRVSASWIEWSSA